MEKIARRCLVVSLLMCASFCITLVVADIHEGTGDLTGLALSCGNCIDGGSDCKDDLPYTCYRDSEEWTQVGDQCPVDCDDDNDGEKCQQNPNAGSMCDDASESCDVTVEEPCVELEPTPENPWTDWECDPEGATQFNCGSYNTCPTS